METDPRHAVYIPGGNDNGYSPDFMDESIGRIGFYQWYVRCICKYFVAGEKLCNFLLTTELSWLK